MALVKIFGRRTHASVFVDVDAAKSVSWGRSWASGFWLQCMYNISAQLNFPMGASKNTRRTRCTMYM
jgi:hypothetical protein